MTHCPDVISPQLNLSNTVASPYEQDYPPDACMTTFTMGQATRLVINYNTYRTGGPAYSPGGRAPPQT